MRRDTRRRNEGAAVAEETIYENPDQNEASVDPRPKGKTKGVAATKRLYENPDQNEASVDPRPKGKTKGVAATKRLLANDTELTIYETANNIHQTKGDNQNNELYDSIENGIDYLTREDSDSSNDNTVEPQISSVTNATFKTRIGEMQSAMDLHRTRFIYLEKKIKFSLLLILLTLSAMLVMVIVSLSAKQQTLPVTTTFLPLGTVIAWLPKIESNGDLEAIPDGWALCDGSTIAKGKWKGKKTPNLAGRFLRGGDVSEVLNIEEDMLLDHGHTASATASFEVTYKDKYVDGSTTPSSGFCYTSSNCGDLDNQKDHDRTMSISTNDAKNTVNISVEKVKKRYRTGSETRPKNIRVVWIMKCW